jgi:hypothetical protein
LQPQAQVHEVEVRLDLLRNNQGIHVKDASNSSLHFTEKSVFLLQPEEKGEKLRSCLVAYSSPSQIFNALNASSLTQESMKKKGKDANLKKRLFRNARPTPHLNKIVKQPSK